MLRYATGERIEVGDVVLQPINDHEEYGVVKEIYQPGDPIGCLVGGGPEGFIIVAWSAHGDVIIDNEIILGQGYIYFVRRK